MRRAVANGRVAKLGPAEKPEHTNNCARRERGGRSAHRRLLAAGNSPGEENRTLNSNPKREADPHATYGPQSHLSAVSPETGLRGRQNRTRNHYRHTNVSSGPDDADL